MSRAILRRQWVSSSEGWSSSSSCVCGRKIERKCEKKGNEPERVKYLYNAEDGDGVQALGCLLFSQWYVLVIRT